MYVERAVNFLFVLYLSHLFLFAMLRYGYEVFHFFFIATVFFSRALHIADSEFPSTW